MAITIHVIVFIHWLQLMKMTEENESEGDTLRVNHTAANNITTNTVTFLPSVTRTSTQTVSSRRSRKFNKNVSALRPSSVKIFFKNRVQVKNLRVKWPNYYSSGDYIVSERLTMAIVMEYNKVVSCMVQNKPRLKLDH